MEKLETRNERWRLGDDEGRFEGKVIPRRGGDIYVYVWKIYRKSNWRMHT